MVLGCLAVWTCLFGCGYLIYGIGENSGMVKYKNGNPCPSPYFRRKQQSLGMMALSEFRRGAEQEINKAHQTNK